jgi:hypothetical protein
MKILGTRIHGYLDYFVALLLLILPGVLGLDVNSPEGVVPMVLGLLTIIYSLMTSYELGVTRVISMKTHLTFDFISGVVLASSPWLFGFAETTYMPHLILGIFEIVASLITRTTTGEQIDISRDLNV